MGGATTGTPIANPAGKTDADWGTASYPTVTHLQDLPHRAFGLPYGTNPDRQVRRNGESALSSGQNLDNDTEAYDLLTQPATINKIGIPLARSGAWNQAYTGQGSTSSRGYGRWIEAGRYQRDGSIIDFTNLASTPSVNSPTWYDSNWQMTTNASNRRYRLRYAVAIEDLSGRILLPRQKPYLQPDVAVPGRPWQTPQPSGLIGFFNPAENRANEFDASWTIAGYHRPFYNMSEISGGQGQQFFAHEVAPTSAVGNGGARGGRYHWQLLFQGLGTALDGQWITGINPDATNPALSQFRYAEAGMYSTDNSRRPHSLHRQADVQWTYSPSASAVPLLAQPPVDPATQDKKLGSNFSGGVASHARTGSVYSWQQMQIDLTTPTEIYTRADGIPNNDNSGALVATSIKGEESSTHALFTFSPFGSQIANLNLGAVVLPYAATHQPIKPSHDGPWQINPLTASPSVVRSMILGLLRGDLKSASYRTISHYPFSNIADPGGWRVYSPTANKTETANDGTDSDGSSEDNTLRVSINGVKTTITVPSTEMYDGVDLFTYAFGPGHLRNAPPSPNTPIFPERPSYNLNNQTSPPQKIPVYNLSAASWTTTETPPQDFPYPGKDFFIDQQELSTLAASGNATDALLSQHPYPSIQDQLGKYITLNLTTGGSIPPAIIPERGQQVDSILSFADTRSGGQNDDSQFIFSNSTSTNGYTYWSDLTLALSHTVALTRANWNLRHTLAFSDATPVQPPSTGTVSIIDTPQAMDAAFLSILGYNPGPSGLNMIGTNPNPNRLVIIKNDQLKAEHLFTYASLSSTKTIAELRTLSLLDESAKPEKSARNAHRARLMERMTNDLRMSFFGSSPNYTGTGQTQYAAPGSLPTAAQFGALDLDGDGTAYSSFTHVINPAACIYPGDAGATVPTGLDPFDCDGDTITSATEPKSGAAETVPWATSRSASIPFSLTGYFAFGKSHYWRMFVRGQVYDTWKGRPVDEVNMQAVFAVDPTNRGTAGIKDSHFIMQQLLPNEPTGWRSGLER